MERDLLKAFEKIHQTLFPLMSRTRVVKMEFFKMVRGILAQYIKPELLTDFKGSSTRSGHMPNYLCWSMSLDIFHLINRDAFRKLRENKDA